MVIAMTGMKRLIGLPVILEGRQIGTVVRGVVSQDGKTLHGLVVRDGLRASRYVESGAIGMLGKLSVICTGKPVRVPREAAFRLFRVTDANGARIGLVTDVLLDEDTLRVAALEISSGPVDDLIAGRWYAASFHVRAMGGTGQVTIPCRQN
ncbi:MAG: PRC-barrel domain-containing protein [Clostridia bacterium]|nr:PRC-barrel domain-containing protein [Clostridia bacterium]